MLKIPAILETFGSLKDKTLKIVFYTNEPTAEQISEVALSTQQFGYLLFKKDDFKQAEINAINELDTKYSDKTKSKSKRLRNVLFIYWQQDNKGYKEFQDFYNNQLEEIINHFKKQLD